MSGLVLKLAANERFVVNGGVLENGDKPSRLRVSDNVRVLRLRDALRPEQVDTPVRQIYYAIQLLITGDLEEAATLPAIDRECLKLAEAFDIVDAELIPTLRQMVARGNYYSALCHLRQLMTLEAELLERKPAEKVA